MHRHIIALVCLWAACGIQEHNAPHKAVPKRPDAGAPRLRDAAPTSQADAPPEDEEPPPDQPDQPDARRSSDRAVVMPPPPDDTPGVDLGGVHVPREKAIVILHFGHSNMLGEAYEPAELEPYFFTSAPRLWIFRADGSFVPAVEPTATTRRRDTAGPGMALLRAAQAKAPADYHFISVGLGVGSATTQDYTKGGLYYSDVVDRALQLKDRATFGAAVVMLGITDRHMPMALQAGFADRVVKIIADLRADLGMPQLPVLHTDYEMEATGTLAPTTDVGLLFRPLILSLPKRITRCAIIPTTGLGMEDDHHFNLAGQKLWSERAIQILVDKQWAPWPAN
jgi:hypothetical protein